MSEVRQTENHITEEDQKTLAELYRAMQENPAFLEELPQARRDELARVLKKASVQTQGRELTDEQAQQVEAIETVLTDTTKAALAGLGGGLLIGALAGGAIVPGLGTILGAGVGATIGLLRNRRRRKDEEAAEVDPTPEQVEGTDLVAEGRMSGPRLLERSTNEAHQTVQHAVDEAGTIIETTLDENGNLVSEDRVGNVTDLPAEEEYTNESGQTVRTVRLMGNLIQLTLESGEDLQELRIVEPKKEIAREGINQTGVAQKQPKATEPAKRKAEELGVDLSQVEGSGAKGRIIVRDVLKAADKV